MNGNFDNYLSINGLKYIDSITYTSNSLILAGYDSDLDVTSIRSYNPDTSLNWSWNQTGFPWSGYLNNSTDKVTSSDNGCIIYVTGNSPTLYVVKLLPNEQVPVVNEIHSPTINAIRAYPNPMHNFLTIEVKTDPILPEKRKSEQASIYNIKGQLVRQIQLHKDKQFTYKALWDGKDIKNSQCLSGIYIIKADGNPYSKKVTIFR